PRRLGEVVQDAFDTDKRPTSTFQQDDERSREILEDEKNKGLFNTLSGMTKAGSKDASNQLGLLTNFLNPFSDKDMTEAGADFVRNKAENIKENPQGVADNENLRQATLDGLTFGLLGDEDKMSNPWLNVTGNLAGSLITGAGIASGLRKVGLGAKYLNNASKATKAAQRAKEGALAGGLYSGVEEGIN